MSSCAQGHEFEPETWLTPAVVSPGSSISRSESIELSDDHIWVSYSCALLGRPPQKKKDLIKDICEMSSVDLKRQKGENDSNMENSR